MNVSVSVGNGGVEVGDGSTGEFVGVGWLASTTSRGVVGALVAVGRGVFVAVGVGGSGVSVALGSGVLLTIGDAVSVVVGVVVSLGVGVGELTITGEEVVDIATAPCTKLGLLTDTWTDVGSLDATIRKVTMKAKTNAAVPTRNKIILRGGWLITVTLSRPTTSPSTSTSTCVALTSIPPLRSIDSSEVGS